MITCAEVVRRGVDERGPYTVRRIGKDEYVCRDFFRDTSIPENPEGKTYAERIAPQQIPFDEALRRKGITRKEWFRQRLASYAAERYGVEIEFVDSGEEAENDG